MEQHVRLQALLHVMVDLHVDGFIQIAEAQELFDLDRAFFGEPHAAMSFIDRVIAGGVFLAGLLTVDHLAADQARDDAIDLVVFIRRFLARPGDDQRRARLVDQDRIDFVDDREVMLALRRNPRCGISCCRADNRSRIRCWSRR